MKYFLLIVLWPVFGFAAKDDGTTCPGKELKERNCLIKIEDIKVNIRDQSVLLMEKGKIQIVPNPFSALNAEWKEAQLRKISQHIIFEFLSWDAPGSDAGQSLVYTAFTINNGKMKQVIVDQIQRRTYNSSTKQFVYSPRDTFKIEVGPDKKLVFVKAKTRQALETN